MESDLGSGRRSTVCRYSVLGEEHRMGVDRSLCYSCGRYGTDRGGDMVFSTVKRIS